jgi:hypothetical protein
MREICLAPLINYSSATVCCTDLPSQFTALTLSTSLRESVLCGQPRVAGHAVEVPQES